MKLLCIAILMTIAGAYMGFIFAIISNDNTDFQDEDQEQIEFLERWKDDHR